MTPVAISPIKRGMPYFPRKLLTASAKNMRRETSKKARVTSSVILQPVVTYFKS